MPKDSTLPKKDKAGRITFSVSFTEDQVKPAEEKALKKLSSNVKIEGFRPGNAPADMLKDKVSPDQLMEEIIRELLPETINKLAKENDLKPIIPPKIEAESREPLTLSLTFVEHPEVSIKGADKIKIEKKDVKIDDKEMDRAIGYILDQHKKTTEVDREAKEGDQVTMDFRGEDENKKEVEGTKTEGHQVVIGSKMLIPGFEDELKGLKKGQDKSFTLKFPEKYHAEHLQNKPVTFHVKIKQVDEVDKPELDDKFAKEHMDAESADDLKKKIKESMEAEENRIDRQRRETELFEKIREATKVELAPELIEEEARDLFENFAQQLKQQNLDFGEWLKKAGKKPEELKSEFDNQAKDRLTLRMGIQQIAESKEIDLTDKEVEEAVTTFLAPLPPEEQERIKPMYKKGMQGWEQIKWQKKVEKLIEMMLS
ncbi:MAG: trigger factor [Candidatus Peribacteraceae bacterium]|jgi:trigger factor|nr:trigger factor [Candidatus Peribacteraceae bacterium]MDP7454864.1 trigger factor [Candidatus Peribacteraceae bacterium]MDP7645680.1 trigger factor [Candidatus Peribacteraceae bacterium]